MFEAVDAFYKAREGAQSSAVTMLRATRPADLAACEHETSPAAASCVVVLIDNLRPRLLSGPQRHEEFSWMLDQCSRAYR